MLDLRPPPEGRGAGSRRSRWGGRSRARTYRCMGWVSGSSSGGCELTGRCGAWDVR